MRRKFITNLIILLSLNLLIKPLWVLGVDLHVQNLVGNQEYGFYISLLNFSFLFNILLDLGLTNFNNRAISQNRQLLQKYFSGIVVIRLFAAIVYTAVIFLIGKIIGYNERQLYFLGFLSLNQFLLSSVLYFRSNIAALHLFKTDSLVSVLDRSLMIVFALILIKGRIFGDTFKIEWLVYLQTAAYLITALVAGSIVLLKSGFRKIYWNPLFFLAILKQSYPYAILTLLMAFYNRFDSVLIERLIEGDEGKLQAGIYAAAFRILDAFNMIAYLFSVLLLPMFSRMIKQKQDIAKLVRLAYTLLFTISVSIASLAFFYNQDLMGLLYHEDTFESARVFGLLMSGFVAISTTYVFGTLLTANGSLRQLNIVAFSGMILSVGLNIILIPHFMAMGSAIASVTAQFITAILQLIIVVRLFRFKADYRLLTQLFAFLIICIGLSYTSHSFLSFYQGILVYGIGVGATIFILRILRFKELWTLFRRIDS